MLPFINVFGITIPMYGLVISTGIALGTAIACFLPCKKNIARQDLFFAVCYAAVGTFVGAKLFYLAYAIPELISAQPPIKMSAELLVYLMQYGFIFYGGIFGAILAVFIYTKKYKLPFINIIEVLIVSVPLIHAFGRIGCFCAGCCYGMPMDPPWGVYFRHDSAAIHGVALFPIQLLEASLNLIIFGFIFWFSRKPRKNGQILGFYFTAYAAVRFVLEFFRYDQSPIWHTAFTFSQLVSLLLLPIGLLLIIQPRFVKKIFNKKQKE